MRGRRGVGGGLAGESTALPFPVPLGLARDPVGDAQRRDAARGHLEGGDEGILDIELVGVPEVAVHVQGPLLLGSQATGLPGSPRQRRRLGEWLGGNFQVEERVIRLAFHAGAASAHGAPGGVGFNGGDGGVRGVRTGGSRTLNGVAPPLCIVGPPGFGGGGVRGVGTDLGRGGLQDHTMPGRRQEVSIAGRDDGG